MRPQISWGDLVGRRVGLWGLGTEGWASLAKLRSLGVEPIIVDDKPPASQPDGKDERVLATADGGFDALQACDVVIKTPGIPRTRPEVATLESAGIPVVGGVGLWLQGMDLSRVLCITGTKGKSTTSLIAGHLAQGLGLRVFVGGNLGTPPYDPANDQPFDLWVIEVSSYQATDIAVTPPVVAVTSLSPDHLPWHGSVEAYYNDKLSLCRQPGAQLTVAAAASPTLVDRRDLLGPEVRWITDSTFDSAWAAPLGLLGEHNFRNASVARACLEAMGVEGADDDLALATAAADFEAPAGRLELIGRVDGVDFVDDGLSTNVLPTLAAVDAFEGRRVALIAGGLDRQIDYEPLALGLAKRTSPTLVLTTYTTGPIIAAALDAHRSNQVEHVACDGMDEAVQRGWEWAKPDGVVLLSPAAASFDAFDDYRHKGRVFRQAMADLS